MFLLLLPVSAAGSESALLQCRALVDRAERLACYDAIPLADEASSRTASNAAADDAAAPPVGSGTTTAPQPAASPEAGFGLPQRRGADAPDTIRSAVAAGFKGWGAGSRIALENGQVWKVVDGSSGVVGRNIRQVTVKRGFMGAYYLHFDGMNKGAKVERVQ